MAGGAKNGSRAQAPVGVVGRIEVIGGGQAPATQVGASVIGDRRRLVNRAGSWMAS